MRMLMKSCVVMVPLLLSGWPVPSIALDVSIISDHLPGLEKLDQLEREIQNDPGNLDHYFHYATMATELREYDKAASMYERMLSAVPNLPRVKLELAMIYMRQQRYEQAQTLLNQVLEGEVPPKVRENLEPMLAELDRATRRHLFSGSLALGAQYDSNANAAPESGIINIRIAGQELPFELDGNSDKQSDLQGFTALTLNHEYRHPDEVTDGVKAGWQSTASHYMNEYDNRDELNVTVTSISTGPTLTALDGRLRTGLKAGYNHITLDNHTYQRQYTGEISAQYALDAATRFRVILTEELRDYVNSPDVRTLDRRDGDARQARIGVTYLYTPQDIFDAQLRVRSEDTKQHFFDNHLQDYSLSYTRQFEENIFTRAHTGFRATDYHAPDPSVSLRTRKEKEWRAGVMVGKTFDGNVTATLGYDYLDVDANITNYSYDNHRISTTVGVRF